MAQAKHKRILLMYISQVSGHRQSAVAIQKSLKAIDPDCEVKSLNGFGHTFPVMEKIVNTAYMGVIKRAPKIWEYLYDNPKIIEVSRELKEKIHKNSHKKLDPLINEFQPDIVICTQAFPCGMVADYKITHQAPFKVVGVLTDFAPHSYWLHPGVDYYIVPSDEAKDRFLKEGVPADKIKVFGIPIRNVFAEKLDRAALAQKLGLSLEVPTLLIMGGGQGLGPIKDVVKALTGLERPLQLIVIAGTNAKLARWLKKIQRHQDKKIIFYSYAHNVEELMEVSTLIISKPGGLTTSECLAKGLPMIVIDPIPGQEERNAQFLAGGGMGMRIDDKKEIASRVDELLNAPDRLQAMRDASLKKGRPQASENLARFILDI